MLNGFDDGVTTGGPDSESKKNIRICMGISIKNCKRYLSAKVLNKKAVLNCRGDFLGFCLVICLIECDLSDFSNSRVVTRT